MNRVLRLVLRDLITFNRSLLVVQFLLPLFLLFVAGFAFKSLIPPFVNGNMKVSYQQFLGVGLIGLTAMNGSLLAGTLLWTDKRHSMYEQILLGPFSRSDYALSKVFSSTLIGLIGALIVASLSYLLIGGFLLTVDGLLIAIAVIVLDAILFGSIAFIIASFVRSLEAFEGIFNFLLIFLTFVSSLLYPLNTLPGALKYVVLVNPLTYAIDALRFALLGMNSGYLIIEILLLSAETIVVLILAFLSINRHSSAD
ncbi:MAG: ABC transporter permease [Conexivisphaerales archaeon]